MDGITSLFKNLSSISTRDKIGGDEFELLEFFVVRLYSKTFNTKEVNKTRWNLFSKDNKVIESNPPTKLALRQDVLRSVLQSSKLQQSLCKDFYGPNACQWDWQKVEKEMIPLWTDLQKASNVCREFVKYGCKMGCTGQCKCLISHLKCPELCQYFGQCTNGKSC